MLMKWHVENIAVEILSKRAGRMQSNTIVFFIDKNIRLNYPIHYAMGGMLKLYTRMGF